MISVAEARQKITDAMPAMPAERIALPAALGRVLAEDLTARRTQPPKAVSAMDGYAVRSGDVTTIPTTLKIVGHVPAGQSYDGTIGPGETVRIFTGAPLPDGADAIVIQENTEPDGDKVNVVDGKATKGRYVRPARS
jgi:molybdopterin molybdotransferase